MGKIEGLTFDSVDPIEVPVTIGGKGYTLKEASGKAGAAYRNGIMRATTLGPDGKAQRVDGIADLEAMLVSMSLYDDDTGKLVPRTVIDGWPDRIVKALFSKLDEISDLEAAQEEAVKNSLESLPDGLE